ncbi:MAG: hypothetical protein U0795_05445 [Pirellulales bacterium]
MPSLFLNLFSLLLVVSLLNSLFAWAQELGAERAMEELSSECLPSNSSQVMW